MYKTSKQYPEHASVEVAQCHPNKDTKE